MNNSLIGILILTLFCQNLKSEVVKYEVVSPDKNLKIEIDFYADYPGSKLTYQVSFKGQHVIEKSLLGIQSGNYNWSSDVESSLFATSSVDTTWHPVYGEKSSYRDNYNQSIISIKSISNKRKEMRLIVRAYNEGVAFRYFFPENDRGGDYLRITKEDTEFTLPEGTKGYHAKYAQAEYELLPINEFESECERPLTLILPNGLFACLLEAEMVNFSRMRFVKSEQKENTLVCKLFGEVDEIEPFKTPWRAIMVAETPGELIENNGLVLNLNPACAIEDPSWIKPGKVMREVTLSTEGAKRLVDFAVKRNLQYIHFDAGWYGYEYTSSSDATTVTVDPRRNPKGDLDIHEAIEYAKSKGIGVIVYVNQRALAKQLDEILPLYKEWGISGIKFGFVHVGSHRWTTWLHEAIKKCAEYGIIVDIHDEYRPTGFSRTYPNLMTQEGIRGNEEFPDATHNTVLPFTRFIAGAGDYTICYYRQDFGKETVDSNGVPRGRYIKTSAVHQLALSVINYSPLQYMYWYDVPEDSQDEPELEFFDAIPTVWDDTKVIQGEIGGYVTIARKSGENWFVGTITNNNPRELEIPLDFLDEGKKYEAKIYSDDATIKTRTKVAVANKKVDSKSVLKVNLEGSQGQAVLISPISR